LFFFVGGGGGGEWGGRCVRTDAHVRADVGVRPRGRPMYARTHGRVREDP
jgi:hypothetical protein